MIFAGILSFIIGVIQALLLKKTLSDILSGNYEKAVLLFLAKTALYVIAAVFLIFCRKSYWIAAAIGYLLGLPVAVTAYFAYQTFRKQTSSGEGSKRKR